MRAHAQLRNLLALLQIKCTRQPFTIVTCARHATVSPSRNVNTTYRVVKQVIPDVDGSADCPAKAAAFCTPVLEVKAP